jgi:hypothetical protein
MERTYTPQQMAQIVANYESLTASLRLAHKRYYERTATERKAYAAAYYEKNKERILNRMAAKRATSNLPAPAE